MHEGFITSVVEVKKAAAMTNKAGGELKAEIADAIIASCDEILSGALRDQFIVDAIQGGAGTSANMNANEVIANQAIELLGGEKGDQHYDSSILPVTQVVSNGVNTYAFTVAATGTLTLHVTADGTVGGTPVSGATFARCDSAGNVYGAPITSDVNGDAVFPYVPFAASGASIIYYKQTTSDGDHEFDPALTNTTMTTATKIIEIMNTPAAVRTISLLDPNCAGLPIASGTLTLT